MTAEHPPTDYPRTLAELLTEAAQLVLWIADTRRAARSVALGSYRLCLRRQQLADLLAQIHQLAQASPNPPPMHTKTPFGKLSADHAGGARWNIEHDGEPLCMVDQQLNDGAPNWHAKRDALTAELIRRWNAFPALVEALCQIAYILKEKRDSDDSTIHAENTAFKSMERWANEALAAANPQKV